MDTRPFELLQAAAGEGRNTFSKDVGTFEVTNNEPSTTLPVVYLMRHAESSAKIFDSTINRYTYIRDIVDPKLSRKGVRQCESVQLYLSQDPSFKLTHILCSPMSRTLDTSMGSFGTYVDRGTKVIAMAELQSFNRGPNGTGLSVDDLQSKYGDQVDLSFLPEDWNDAEQKSVSRNGRYSNGKRNVEKVKAMMESIRSAAFPDQVRIGVVAHSSCLKHWVAVEGWRTMEIDPYLCDQDDGEYAFHVTQGKIIKLIPLGMTRADAVPA